VPDVAKDNAELFKVIYAGPMMEFFTRFLGGPIRHYDFTWFRAVAPGVGSLPHCDVPYMGRGTHNLYTAWTPVGDVDFEQGGLMILEESPKHVERLRSSYVATVRALANAVEARDADQAELVLGEHVQQMLRSLPDLATAFPTETGRRALVDALCERPGLDEAKDGEKIEAMFGRTCHDLAAAGRPALRW